MTSAYIHPLHSWYVALGEDNGAFTHCAIVSAPSPEHINSPLTPLLKQAIAALEAYSQGSPLPSLPLNPQGTAFERRVWQGVQAIAYGQTWTYGQLAAHCGLSPAYARAVGGAVGRNPLSLFIPCHRVVGKSGLGGYAWGLPLKQYLLALEGQTTEGQTTESRITESRITESRITESQTSHARAA